MDILLPVLQFPNEPILTDICSGGDIERKMLENAGLIDIDEKGPTALEPVICTRWWSMNAVDVIYCARCSMALNEQVVMKVGQSADGVVESEGYRAFPGWLRKELGWCGFTQSSTQTTGEQTHIIPQLSTGYHVPWWRYPLIQIRKSKHGQQSKIVTQPPAIFPPPILPTRTLFLYIQNYPIPFCAYTRAQEQISMKETEQEVLNHIPDPLGKPVWENRTAEEQNNWQNLPYGEVQTCSPQCR